MSLFKRQPEAEQETGSRSGPMEYEDFTLSIEEWSDGEYKISTQSDEGGEVSHKVSFPLDRPEFQAQLVTLDGARRTLRDMQVSTPEASPTGTANHGQMAKDFGRELFDLVLAGNVLTRFRVAEAAADDDDKGLRVRLRIDPPELARLPWEFLFDTEARDYVAISAKTPVTRYLALPQARKQLLVKPPLRILGMTASPGDHAELDISRERERIDRATQALRESGDLELKWIEQPTRSALRRNLAAGGWHVFHFVGHGGFDPAEGPDGEGLILLAEETGDGHMDNSQSFRLYASDLGTMLAEGSIRLAVLNSCEGAKAGQEDIFSSTASTLMQRGVPSVVAMQYEITDSAAVEFASSLYGGLSAGAPVDAAVTMARHAVRMKFRRTLEWATPVLHMRSKDGKLFHTGSRPIGPTDVRGIGWMAGLTLATAALAFVSDKQLGVSLELLMLLILIGIGLTGALNPNTKMPVLFLAGAVQPFVYALVTYLLPGKSPIDLSTDALPMIVLALFAGLVAVGAWWGRALLAARIRRARKDSRVAPTTLS